MLEGKEVSYAIHGKQILDRCNVEAKAGELLALIGPNGAGKSTLIKCLAGLIEPHSGEVLLMDEPLSTFPKRVLARWRAYFSQSQENAFGYTVEDIVALGRLPYYAYMPTEDDHRIALDAMIETGVEHLRHRKVATLSGGERQRVHFARVLAQLGEIETSYPFKALLLDEPVNNLDPRYQLQLLETAKKFAARQNLAVVIVLHDINLASRYADRTVVMNHGRIVAQGETPSVLTEALLGSVYEMSFKVIPAEHGQYVLCDALA